MGTYVLLSTTTKNWKIQAKLDTSTYKKQILVVLLTFTQWTIDYRFCSIIATNSLPEMIKKVRWSS
jgi:hypothetical protein